MKNCNVPRSKCSSEKLCSLKPSMICFENMVKLVGFGRFRAFLKYPTFSQKCLLTSNLLFVGYPEVAVGRLRVHTWVGPDDPNLPSGDLFGPDLDGAKLGRKNVGNGPSEAINPLAVAPVGAHLKD